MTLSVTRLDLKNYALRAIHGNETHDVAAGRAERGIENALKMLGRARRWSFHQNTYDVVTTAPTSFTSSLSVNNNSTSVSDSGSGIPSTAVGAFFEFNSERHLYECTVRSSAAAATILQAYTNEGATNLSGVSGKLYFLAYDLPANFGTHNELVNVTRFQSIQYVPYEANWLLHAGRAGSGDPTAFTIAPKRHDPNQWQMIFYPAPATAQRYQLVYYRQPGWFDTATPATSTWKREATADTDYVDWPDDAMHLLRAAVLAKVAEEIKPDRYGQYYSNYQMEMQQSANADRVAGKPRLLSRGVSRPQASRWEFP